MKKKMPNIGKPNPNLTRQAWETFQATGLLWWVNRTLHLFGWAIVLEFELDKKTGDRRITDAYPARTRWRGFDNKTEDEGFIRLSEYLATNIKTLVKETKS